MNIGIDLDDTVYKYPEFFKELVEGLTSRGHKFFCTSAHSKSTWHSSDVPRLLALGIDVNKIDPSLLNEPAIQGGASKGRQADRCDFVFDDHAAQIQPHTKTPIFRVP